MAETKKLNAKGYYVKIIESAFIDICLSALEAYCVKHPESPPTTEPLETFGLLWGHETALADGATLYTIQKASVDTSTKRTPDACAPNSDSLKLKYDFMTAFFPDLEYLGDFHTHPYLKTAQTISKGDLYDASPGDIEVIKGNAAEWISFNRRIFLVVTIGRSRKHEDGIKPSKKPEKQNMIQFAFGNYRLWIQAHVVYKLPNRDALNVTTKRIRLQVSGSHLDSAYTSFGEFDKDHVAHIAPWDDLP
jgi:hypothetical protein